MARDNFSNTTIQTLAKRVGYLCSNCSQPTIGPHSDVNKTTLIGVAAHITAAAEGGPRFDSSLSSAQRCSINNGIWLCSDCASLIDKDEAYYTVELIRALKEKAENESHNKISKQTIVQSKTPYIEVDLIHQNSLRAPDGISRKNYFDPEQQRYIDPDIYFWNLRWNYILKIYNNAKYVAYNVTITNIGDRDLVIDNLRPINNIPPLEFIDVNVRLFFRIEGRSSIADDYFHNERLKVLKDVILEINYLDEERVTHKSQVKWIDGKTVTSFLH